MRNRLEQSVLSEIRDARFFHAGQRVGVAVSGGADSVALLRLLESLRGELGIILSVVHFNHSLRGSESEADEQFVAQLAGHSRLNFLVSKEDVLAAATSNGWNLEDASRRLRYAFFQRLVDEKKITRVAVAHTADDQAETVLARIIRGTGFTGLGGIYPVAGSVVRPLLRFRRKELRAYLEAKGQSWREDSTNLDLRRTRARIRAQILPQLEADFSPQIVTRLEELSRLAREEEVFWQALVEERFHAGVKQETGRLAFHIPDLLHPEATQAATSQSSQSAAAVSARWLPLSERLIRRLYEEVRGGLHELSSQHVAQVIHLATASSSGHRIQLPGGIIVERAFDTLTFLRSESAAGIQPPARTDQFALAYRYEVALQSTGTTSVSVPELGCCFRLKVIDWPLAESDTKTSCQALDADLLGGSVVLRNWQPGDAYRPLGRGEPRKLKELFRAIRARAGERAVWPVLESRGRVIWARGLPPAQEFSASRQTRAGVLIEEVRL
ncbi:MAG TPA: tRNA lysidine(34) synthetase TilS [Candidatus Acidoferrales bacterium]|nr:tRNA lysidine(34) synthetase TilS [Candidatus Acidoferrales bacterium]